MLSGTESLSPRNINASAPLHLPIIWAVGGHRSSGGSAGMLELSFTREGRDTTRLLGRGWGLYSETMEAKARCDLPGYDGAGVQRMVAAASVNDKALALASVLPVAITPNTGK